MMGAWMPDIVAPAETHRPGRGRRWSLSSAASPRARAAAIEDGGRATARARRPTAQPRRRPQAQPSSCPAAGGGCSPTGASSPSTATRATTSSARWASARPPNGQAPAQAGQALRPEARPVLPAMELITTVATAAPGEAGLYRDHISFAQDPQLPRSRAQGRCLAVLDIQPGRGEFGPEIERLAPFLREPDVGLALDPEWHVAPDAAPGQGHRVDRRRRRQRRRDATSPRSCASATCPRSC